MTVIWCFIVGPGIKFSRIVAGKRVVTNVPRAQRPFGNAREGVDRESDDRGKSVFPAPERTPSDSGAPRVRGVSNVNARRFNRLGYRATNWRPDKSLKHKKPCKN